VPPKKKRRRRRRNKTEIGSTSKKPITKKGWQNGSSGKSACLARVRTQVQSPMPKQKKSPDAC
jgi:hypothetical protein